jgi:cysteine desulfurase / selenocysteine lyase
MRRRDFVETITSAAALMATGITTGRERATRAADWRRSFPSLAQQINGHPLVYLDSAATTLRPAPVIDALVRFYRTDNANPGATLHTLARRAYATLEAARATVASFIGASDPLEVCFTRGTTEGLNLVAATWGLAHLRAGDEILIGRAEHASNMLPWRYLARRTGARLIHFDVDDAGHPRIDELIALVKPRTRIIAFSHVSNVLGIVNPVRQISEAVRGPDRIVVVDGAQSVPHFPVNVHDLGCDFLAFSSHKMLGPMGVGVLWGRRELLDAMPPYQTGANMAHDIGFEREVLSDGGLKYSAGTPNVSGPVGLAAAIDYIRGIGFPAIVEHEQSISRRMLARLADMPRVRLLGAPDAAQRVSVFSFVVDGRSPLELLRALDAKGIAIRAGDLASLPLMQRYGVRAAARASCYLYTTAAEIDRFCDVLANTIA